MGQTQQPAVMEWIIFRTLLICSMSLLTFGLTARFQKSFSVSGQTYRCSFNLVHSPVATKINLKKSRASCMPRKGSVTNLKLKPQPSSGYVYTVDMNITPSNTRITRGIVTKLSSAGNETIGSGPDNGGSGSGVGGSENEGSGSMIEGSGSEMGGSGSVNGTGMGWCHCKCQAWPDNCLCDCSEQQRQQQQPSIFSWMLQLATSLVGEDIIKVVHQVFGMVDSLLGGLVGVIEGGGDGEEGVIEAMKLLNKMRSSLERVTELTQKEWKHSM